MSSRAYAQTSTSTSTDVSPRQSEPPPGAREGTAIGGAATAWKPSWEPRPHKWDFVITGVAIAAAIGSNIVPPRNDATFPRYALFDEGARDTLRLGSLDWRYRIRDASDVGVSLLTTWPVLVDALIGAWWHRGNSEVARNIAFIDAEVIALVAATQGLTTTVASRERPFGPSCGATLPEKSVDCEPQVRYRSFFSGHASQSFAGASVLCVNHLGMRLLGNAGDVATCVIAISVATATSTFRMMGDMHFASDVLTGALVGTAIGLGVPLLHGTSAADRSDKTAGALKLRLAPVESGLGVRGTF